MRELGGSLIRASVKKKKKLPVYKLVRVCSEDAAAGRRNIRWGIKVYAGVETVGLFLLPFYRVPVALGKSL